MAVRWPKGKVRALEPPHAAPELTPAGRDGDALGAASARQKPVPFRPSDVLALQRVVGNRAVAGLLAQGTHRSIDPHKGSPASSPGIVDAPIGPTRADDADRADVPARATRPASLGATAPHVQRAVKQLDFLVMKRKKIRVLEGAVAAALSPAGRTSNRLRQWIEKTQAEDSYGHWWVEAGAATHDPEDQDDWQAHRSWGWWPSRPPGMAQTFKLFGHQVPGALNAGERLDPHHGEKADEAFAPAMDVGDNENDQDVAKRVLAAVNNFAIGFKGTWNWRYKWGKNCHTFQERLMDALGLRRQHAQAFTHSGGQGSRGGPKAGDWILSKLLENKATGKSAAIPAMTVAQAKQYFGQGISWKDWQEAATDAQIKAAIFRSLGLAGPLAEAKLDGVLEKAYFPEGDGHGNPINLRLFRPQPQQPVPAAEPGVVVRTAIVSSTAFHLGPGRDPATIATALPDSVQMNEYVALEDEQRARVLALVRCTADELNRALEIKYRLPRTPDIFVDPPQAT